MLEISFEIEGQKVNPQDISDTMEKILYTNVIEYITNRVENVRCPDHGDYPRIVCKGNNIQNISFEIYGCCDKLINAAKEKLS